MSPSLNPKEKNNAAQSLSIRPFPYPYKAALAICNDLDGYKTFAEMKAVHDVLNGTRMTPCGPGLGLEIGDSLHCFSVHPQQDDTFAYFEGLTPRPSSAAAVLRDGIKSGILDILHTWGNYSQRGGFVREQALWAINEFDKYDLKMSVWTNHGDRHNFQNIGRFDSLGDLPEMTSARGDRSDVLEYHADLARRLGIRYVWIKELTPIPGQERPLRAQDYLNFGTYLTRTFAKSYLTSSSQPLAKKPLQLTNRMLRMCHFRDSSLVFEMLRYGFFNRDGGDNLPELLSSKFLRQLVDCGGACLLYMHLGKGRPSPEIPFSKSSYQALERLAQWAQAGDIWVTTASRLCRYVELRQSLRLQQTAVNQETVVEGKFLPVEGLPPPEIDGLTFYAAEAPPLRLVFNDRTFSLQDNPPDHTRKPSFSVPSKPSVYCWA